MPNRLAALTLCLCLAGPAAAGTEAWWAEGRGAARQLSLLPVPPGALPATTCPLPDEEEDAAELATVWSDALSLAWSAARPLRCSAGVATSYDAPDAEQDLSLHDVLDGGRFRAWLQSGLQWRYAAAAVLALDARWSPVGLDGLSSSTPFQAAATITVPW